MGTFSTTVVPTTVSIYEHHATFWRKTKPKIFGAIMSELPPELRAKLQRNTGAYVTHVVNGTPAFRANIMRGDVIVAIAGVEITSIQEARSVLEKYAEQEVEVRFLRGESEKSILTKLNRLPL